MDRPRGKPALLSSIQFLRGVAACMVVHFHTLSMLREDAGYDSTVHNTESAGVDIFFVISGFVIFLITDESQPHPVDFLARRAIRIAPPYWFYTSITLGLLLLVPGAYEHLEFDPFFALASYLFLLSDDGAGGAGTVLGVGWTIAYEVYFYVVFTLALVQRRVPPLRILAAVFFLGAVSAPFAPTLPAPMHVWASVLPLEFLAGCGLGLLRRQGSMLSRQTSLVTLTVCCGCILVAGSFDLVRDQFDRVLLFGIPSIGVVYAALSLDARATHRFPTPALAIGDSSYSLYLSHQFVLAVCGRVWTHLGLQRLPSFALYTSSALACIAVGWISYRILEKPVTQWLNIRWTEAR